MLLALGVKSCALFLQVQLCRRLRRKHLRMAAAFDTRATALTMPVSTFTRLYITLILSHSSTYGLQFELPALMMHFFSTHLLCCACCLENCSNTYIRRASDPSLAFKECQYWHRATTRRAALCTKILRTTVLLQSACKSRHMPPVRCTLIALHSFVASVPSCKNG
jgi:hypothetical protein